MASRRSEDQEMDYRSRPHDRDGGMYDDTYYARPGERSATRSNSSHGHNRLSPQWCPNRETRGRDPSTTQELLRNESGLRIRGRASETDHETPYRYRDRDQEGYRSPHTSSASPSNSPGLRESRSHHSRSRSPNKRPRPRHTGQPNREIMLDGLAPEIREEDVRKQITHGLQSQYNVGSLEDVRIIRDRQSGESRGFGFIRFAKLNHAEDFLQAHYPHIHLSNRASSEANPNSGQIRIAYSRDREDKTRANEAQGDWTCVVCSMLNYSGQKICFRCHSPPVDMSAYHSQGPPQEYTNSGDSDAAMQGSPSQFVLLRGLEPNVTEDLLAKGVSKLLKPNQRGNAADPAAKKNKITSTTDNANLGAREGTIRRVFLIRDRQTDESWRYGFAEFAGVDDAQAAMLRFKSLEKFTISSKLVSVSYIHTGVFVPVFESLEERFMFSPLGNIATKLRYWNEGAYASELAVARAEDDDANVQARKTKLTTDIAAAAAYKEGLLPAQDDGVRSKKRKADSKEKETSAKSKQSTPAHLQFWSNRHAELHGAKFTDSSGRSEDSREKDVSTARAPAADTPRQSYASPNKLCCFLCARQFKSAAEVNKHERLSQLHRDNLANGDLVRKATLKLKKAGLPIAPTEVGDEGGSEYRDRARERRQAFGPSKRISLPLKKQETPESQALPVLTDASSQSKGAALLSKMGWTTGKGLGAHGEGATEAIATDVYAAGVGLGAEGGKIGDAAEEAARSSRGDYKEFLQKAKDKAKARFESMSG